MYVCMAEEVDKQVLSRAVPQQIVAFYAKKIGGLETELQELFKQVCMHVCVYVCFYVCMYVCMFLSMYVCKYVCYVCIYVCKYLLYVRYVYTVLTHNLTY